MKIFQTRTAAGSIRQTVIAGLGMLAILFGGTMNAHAEQVQLAPGVAVPGMLPAKIIAQVEAYFDEMRPMGGVPSDQRVKIKSGNYPVWTRAAGNVVTLTRIEPKEGPNR